VKCITLLIIVLGLQGCAAAPRAREAAGTLDVERIMWTRGSEASAFRDQFGVCHVFSEDRQAALRTVGTQVKACFERSLPLVAVDAPAERIVKMTWQRVPASRIDELFAQTADTGFLHAARRRKAALFSVNGFYEYHGDTCYVVVADHQEYLLTLGHEFKHCVDGDFHDDRGVWRQQRAG
jgi:hypothetical protein